MEKILQFSSPGWAADASGPSSDPITSSPPSLSSPPHTPTRRSLKAGDDLSRSNTPGGFHNFQQSRLSAAKDSLDSSLSQPNCPAFTKSVDLPRQGPIQRTPRSSFKKPPSALLPSSSSERGNVSDGQDADVTIRLSRQRFKARCHAALAREKGRRQAVARARGRDVLSEGGESTLTGGETTPDSAYHSDFDDPWALQQDEEVRLLAACTRSDEESTDSTSSMAQLVRRIMVTEYRRMLQEQEISGNQELGWLGADEVAWLEEELQRDGQRQQQQLEPPPDFLDEEAALYEQYEHALQPRLPSMGYDEDIDLDEPFWDDEEALQRIEVESCRLSTFGSNDMDVS